MSWRKTRVRKETEGTVFYRRYDITKKFCICECRSKYGLADIYLAIVVSESGERVVGRHRAYTGARKKIENLANRMIGR